MVSKVATIIFFLAFGIAHFTGIGGLALLAAVAAIVAGIALLANC